MTPPAPETQTTPSHTPYQQLDAKIHYQVPGSPYTAGEVADGGEDAIVAADVAAGVTLADHLFSMAAAPPRPNNQNTICTLGTQLQATRSGLRLTEISFYWNSPQLYSTYIGVFDQTGLLLVSRSVTARAGWTVSSISPVQLDPAKTYWVCYLSLAQMYVYQLSYTWNFASQTGGLVHVLSGGQHAGGALALPAATTTAYFVDATIQP